MFLISDFVFGYNFVSLILSIQLPTYNISSTYNDSIDKLSWCFELQTQRPVDSLDIVNPGMLDEILNTIS